MSERTFGRIVSKVSRITSLHASKHIFSQNTIVVSEGKAIFHLFFFVRRNFPFPPATTARFLSGLFPYIYIFFRAPPYFPRFRRKWRGEKSKRLLLLYASKERGAKGWGWQVTLSKSGEIRAHNETFLFAFLSPFDFSFVMQYWHVPPLQFRCIARMQNSYAKLVYV